MSSFGLIGTITSDRITLDCGRRLRGVGGILYQAAALCGLGERVFLYSNCGSDLKADVGRITRDWKTLCPDGLNFIPGPGHRVFLAYEDRTRERRETLESTVPPLDAVRILDGLGGLDFLFMVFNSGFDLTLPGWRRIVRAARCPIWLDVHSLVLSKNLHGKRSYAALPEWREWAAGVDFLQANLQEAACLLGHPDSRPKRDEISGLAAEAFKIGVRGVLVTQGERGVRVETPGNSRLIRSPEADAVVDTTVCGDVFGAKTAQGLARQMTLLESAKAGVALASLAAGVAGIRKTFDLARKIARKNASGRGRLML
jgi:sugar/nucleoside kinase (ribokinase family)